MAGCDTGYVDPWRPRLEDQPLISEDREPTMYTYVIQLGSSAFGPDPSKQRDGSPGAPISRAAVKLEVSHRITGLNREQQKELAGIMKEFHQEALAALNRHFSSLGTFCKKHGIKHRQTSPNIQAYCD